MTFLLHQDMCAACIRKHRQVNQRCAQETGRLAVSAITVMGLELWLLRPQTPLRYQQWYIALRQQVTLLNVDDEVAHRAASLGHGLRGRTPRLTTVDLLTAATALVHKLMLVTHDTRVFAQVPGLALEDWFLP